MFSASSMALATWKVCSEGVPLARSKRRRQNPPAFHFDIEGAAHPFSGPLYYIALVFVQHEALISPSFSAPEGGKGTGCGGPLAISRDV